MPDRYGILLNLFLKVGRVEYNNNLSTNTCMIHCKFLAGASTHLLVEKGRQSMYVIIIIYIYSIDGVTHLEDMCTYIYPQSFLYFNYIKINIPHKDPMTDVGRRGGMPVNAL